MIINEILIETLEVQKKNLHLRRGQAMRLVVAAYEPGGGDAAYLDHENEQLYVNSTEGFVECTPEELLALDENPLYD